MESLVFGPLTFWTLPVLKIIPSSDGVFEITIGDKLIFSKKELGRFPEENEIEEIVKKQI